MPSDNPNITDDTSNLQMSPPGALTPAVAPEDIELLQPEFPPDILPLRLLKVAGIAFGVPEGMTQEQANDRLLSLNDPPPAPVLAIANMDDPTSISPPFEDAP